jgi:hypothetical protein
MLPRNAPASLPQLASGARPQSPRAQSLKLMLSPSGNQALGQAQLPEHSPQPTTQPKP